MVLVYFSVVICTAEVVNENITVKKILRYIFKMTILYANFNNVFSKFHYLSTNYSIECWRTKTFALISFKSLLVRASLV